MKKHTSMIISKEATLVGAFMYIILLNLDKEDLVKGSVARLKERIFARLRKSPRKYAKEADALWSKIIANNPQKFSLYISPVIETLFFNHEAVMLSMFGDDFGDIVSRATMKMAYGDNEEALRNSYIMADIISKEVLNDK